MNGVNRGKAVVAGRMRKAWLVALLVAAIMPGPVAADGLRLRTELSSGRAWATATSLDAALGYASHQATGAGVRLIHEKTLGDFRIELQGVITARRGSDVGYRTALAASFPPVPPATLFDLGQTWRQDATTLIAGRIDRLSLGYAGPNLVLRIGRQAITWGSGIVFHPADIVAPFPPDAVDTTYKPGADMIYAQYLFDSGADIQAIALPRPLVPGGPVAFANSTYAVRGKTLVGALDLSAMFARDRGDSAGSVGLAGALGGASWNAQYIGWKLAGGAGRPSWLVNISSFGTLAGRNMSWFAEIYHNGFGVAPGVPLSLLPADLLKRSATGQVFVMGRDFAALGGRVELNPDLSASPTALFSLNDGSVLLNLRFDYSLGDNTDILFAASRPFGRNGSEFGGRETAPGSGIYARPATRLTVKLVRYF